MSKAYIVPRRAQAFGDHEVLKGVSTVFHTGEVTVIIGASGSGKSTLLRAINRLEPHDSGSITIDGVEVTDDQPRCSSSAARSAWCSSSSTCSAT
jgi:polar amino acid transport system ATP-binding protein